MVNTGIPFFIFMFCPSQIKNYIITGLVSNFFNASSKRVKSSMQKRKHHKLSVRYKVSIKRCHGPHNMPNFSFFACKIMCAKLATKVIFYVGGGTYNLTSTTNDKFLRNFSWQFLFYSQTFCQKSLLRENRRRINFCILFWCLPLGSKLGFTSNNPTHYLLNYGPLAGLQLRSCIWSTFIKSS